MESLARAMLGTPVVADGSIDHRSTDRVSDSRFRGNRGACSVGLRKVADSRSLHPMIFSGAARCGGAAGMRVSGARGPCRSLPSPRPSSCIAIVMISGHTAEKTDVNHVEELSLRAAAAVQPAAAATGMEAIVAPQRADRGA